MTCPSSTCRPAPGGLPATVRRPFHGVCVWFQYRLCSFALLSAVVSGPTHVPARLLLKQLSGRAADFVLPALEDWTQMGVSGRGDGTVQRQRAGCFQPLMRVDRKSVV